MLSEEEIHHLCFGARTDGPAICYEAASDQLTLSNVEAIRLCRCAASERPVSCFEDVRERTDVWTEPAIATCNEITVRHLRFDCTPMPTSP